jgi:hypothetical protein
MSLLFNHSNVMHNRMIFVQIFAYFKKKEKVILCENQYQQDDTFKDLITNDQICKQFDSF